MRTKRWERSIDEGEEKKDWKKEKTKAEGRISQ